MKKFGLLFASALALLALASCNDEEDDITPVEQGDAYWAAQATVTSSDANFTATEDGGTIHFKTEGGSVSLNIDCGCGWIAENSATDLFATSLTASTLTVTADQNTVEEDLAGTITLMTENQRITFATIAVTQTAYGAPEITVETNEWRAPAVGALTTEIAVEASADWTAESADEWLTVTKTDSGITLTVAENEETEERSTKATLTCTDGIRTEYEYVAVSQDGLAYITLSDDSLTLLGNASSTTVAVETNFDDWSCDTSDGWITFTRDGDALTVTVEINEGESRNGTVTVTAGDGAENVAEAQLTVTQCGIADMILTYTIATANTSTKLPLYGTVNCTVDWGDGSEAERIFTTQPSHTYAEAGEYDIIVNGTVTQIRANGISTTTDPLPLTAIKQWGNTGLTSLNDAFWYCENLKSLPEYTGTALDGVTDFYAAFYYCTVLEEIPEGMLDGCTLAKDFQWIFSHCEAIKTLPQRLFNNCTSATTFKCAFQSCTSLETIPDGLFENCTEVTSFYQTFVDCQFLKTIPTGLFDKNTKVKEFHGTFYECYSIETVPSMLFTNCPDATDFSWCFFNCLSLKTIAADAFNCPAATDMSYLFADCPSITEIPAGLFDSCDKVTSFAGAFMSDYGLKTIRKGLFDNCRNVKDYSYIFCDNTSLTTVPDGLFANCPEATTFESAFYGCSSLKTIPADTFASCPKATIFSDVFCGCNSLEGISAGFFDGCPEATSFRFLFYETSLSSIPEGLFTKNTKADDFYSAFYDCTNVTMIPDNLFATCTVATRFAFVFRGCTGITSLPENLFANCPEASDFQAAFHLISITEIPANLFANNKKILNLQSAFNSCSKITSGESPYDMIDGVPVHLYERINYPDIYTAPTDYNYCFGFCTGLSDYNNIPSDWGGGASTSSISGKSASLTESHPTLPTITPEEVAVPLDD